MASKQAKLQDNEKWILGSWNCERHHHGDRTIIFHSDHSWGVAGYVPDREEIGARHWRIEGHQLIRTYPDDQGFRTISDEIISFSSERFKLDDDETFTRENAHQAAGSGPGQLLETTRSPATS